MSQFAIADLRPVLSLSNGFAVLEMGNRHCFGLAQDKSAIGNPFRPWSQRALEGRGSSH